MNCKLSKGNDAETKNLESTPELSWNTGSGTTI
jgi:hypothetical protein